MPNPFFKFYQYLKDSYKSIALTCLAFIFLGILYVFNASPQYLVSVAIDQKTDAQGELGSNSLLSALGGGAQNGSKFYYEIKEVMYSMDVTERFEENHGGLNDYFGSLFDESSQTYKPLWNLNTILKKIKFFFLGVSYDPIPNLHFLNQVIRGTINIRFDDFAELIYISSYTSSPALTSKLINGAILETDASMKSSEKFELEERINFLIQELGLTSTIEQREALSKILENQLLKKSLINSDALYKIMIVRDIEVSEYPVKPSLSFIMALFLILGLLTGIGSHAIKFIRKELAED